MVRLYLLNGRRMNVYYADCWNLVHILSLIRLPSRFLPWSGRYIFSGPGDAYTKSLAFPFTSAVHSFSRRHGSGTRDKVSPPTLPDAVAPHSAHPRRFRDLPVGWRLRGCDLGYPGGFDASRC